MKHDHLTDQQIREALLKAGYEHLWRVAELRAVLDALPDPDPVTDEWEQCEVSDYRPGDMPKAVSEEGAYEFYVPIHSAKIEDNWVSFTLENGTKFDVNLDTNKFFRIPAPVQNPDPEEHPLIIVHNVRGDVMPEDTYARAATKGPSRSPGYHLIPGDDPQVHWNVDPDDITDWVPARVVAAGDDRG